MLEFLCMDNGLGCIPGQRADEMLCCLVQVQRGVVSNPDTPLTYLTSIQRPDSDFMDWQIMLGELGHPTLEHA